VGSRQVASASGKPDEVVVCSAAKHNVMLWRQTLRMHQWVKNELVLLPPLLSHSYPEAAADIAILEATLALCLCSSSVYLLNDLLDLQADRRPSDEKEPALRYRRAVSACGSGAHSRGAVCVRPSLALCRITQPGCAWRRSP
jgi:hypothetical protein